MPLLTKESLQFEATSRLLFTVLQIYTGANWVAVSSVLMLAQPRWSIMHTSIILQSTVSQPKLAIRKHIFLHGCSKRGNCSNSIIRHQICVLLLSHTHARIMEAIYNYKKYTSRLGDEHTRVTRCQSSLRRRESVARLCIRWILLTKGSHCASF